MNNNNSKEERITAMLEFINCFPTTTATTTNSNPIHNIYQLNDGVVLFEAFSTL